MLLFVLSCTTGALAGIVAIVVIAVWFERRRLARRWQTSRIHSPRVIKYPPVVVAPSATPDDQSLGTLVCVRLDAFVYVFE